MLKLTATALLAGVAYSQTTLNPFAGCWDLMMDQMNNNPDGELTINYVNHLISGFNLPLAIGQCTAASLVAGGTYMFECNEAGDEMTRYTYSDGACATETDTYTWSQNATGTEEMAFECNGVDEYLVTDINARSDCDGDATDFRRIAVAVARCAANDVYDVNVYCSGEFARIQFFAPGAMCMDPYQCRGNDTTATCEPWFRTSDGLVYGSVHQCGDSPGDDDDSAFMTSGLIGSLIAGFAMMYLH